MGKKRGANEGSVHQRKDGRWCASINLGYRKGRRHRKHILGHTRAEVADKLNEELQKHKKGLDIAPEKQTVAQFLEHWLTNSVKPTVRPKTFKSYQQLIRVHLFPVSAASSASLGGYAGIGHGRNLRLRISFTSS